MELNFEQRQLGRDRDNYVDYVIEKQISAPWWLGFSAPKAKTQGVLNWAEGDELPEFYSRFALLRHAYGGISTNTELLFGLKINQGNFGGYAHFFTGSRVGMTWERREPWLHWVGGWNLEQYEIQKSGFRRGDLWRADLGLGAMTHVCHLCRWRIELNAEYLTPSEQDGKNLKPTAGGLWFLSPSLSWQAGSIDMGLGVQILLSNNLDAAEDDDYRIRLQLSLPAD